MAKDNAEFGEGNETLHELRRAVLELGNAVRAFSRSRLDDIGEEVSDDARVVAQEGRRLLEDVHRRLGRLEHRVERSVRDHPGGWVMGVLGVIGLGLVLGIILRRPN